MSASASSSSKRQKKESVEIAHMHVLSNNPKTVKSQSTTMSATIQTPSMKMESNDSELSTDLLLIKKESLRKKLIAFGSFDSNSSSLCCDSLMGSASEPVNLSAQSPRGSTDKGLTKPGKLFQWDYLLKEMQWLAGDVQKERQRHIGNAKKLIRSIESYAKTREIKKLKKAKDEIASVRRVASRLSKDVRKFWLKINKVITFKQKTESDEIRQKAMDKHLTFLVKQTERYTAMLTDNLRSGGAIGLDIEASKKATASSSSLSRSYNEISSSAHALSSSTSIPKKENVQSSWTSSNASALGLQMFDVPEEGEDSDYEWDTDDEEMVVDDETTMIEEEARGVGITREEELALLEQDKDIPIEQLRAMYANLADMDDDDDKHQESDDASDDQEEVDAEDSTSSFYEKDDEEEEEEEVEEDSSFGSEEAPPDDETTMIEEEARGAGITREEELALLEQDKDIPIEQLRAMYANLADMDDDDDKHQESDDASDDQEEVDAEDNTSSFYEKDDEEEEEEEVEEDSSFGSEEASPDDETTMIEEEARGAGITREEELALLEQDKDIPIEQLRAMYANLADMDDDDDKHQESDDASDDQEEVDAEDNTSSFYEKDDEDEEEEEVEEDSSFGSEEAPPDDETTMIEEEARGAGITREEELALLEQDKDIPIEQLRAMYANLADMDDDDDEHQGPDDASDDQEEVDAEDSTSSFYEKDDEEEEEEEDSSFGSEEAPPDDETTMIEEEARGVGITREEELTLLEQDKDIPIEQLRAMYADMLSSGNECLGSGSDHTAQEEVDDDDVEDDDDYVCGSKHSIQNSTGKKKSVSFAALSSSSAVDKANSLPTASVALISDEKRRSPRLLDLEKTSSSGSSSSSSSNSSSGNVSDALRRLEAADEAARSIHVEIPFVLSSKLSLREYQHIGLNWLVSLHERRLNGILADEMGLGKTIQTIALLAYLAACRGIWGPHLVVVPTSCIVNWETEFKKWCPIFKVLTYYGSSKARKQLRVGWSRLNSFHVCITSYQLVVQDTNAFKRKRWYYMILDEAHNIKNFKSQRWQTLLNFNTQRRLLLTGTPLQNNLMELWSLMHFLMPHIFRSRKEFSYWFSNPLNSVVEGNRQVNNDLISRLHSIMRPFLLRRLKKDVAKQLPGKFEHVVMCKLSKRQLFLYEEFMSRSATKAAMSGGNYLGMMNILMQLRKVCNHPDLFEPRPITSSYVPDEVVEFTALPAVSKLMNFNPFENLVAFDDLLNFWAFEEDDIVAALLQQYHPSIDEYIVPLSSEIALQPGVNDDDIEYPKSIFRASDTPRSSSQSAASADTSLPLYRLKSYVLDVHNKLKSQKQHCNEYNYALSLRRSMKPHLSVNWRTYKLFNVKTPLVRIYQTLYGGNALSSGYDICSYLFTFPTSTTLSSSSSIFFANFVTLNTTFAANLPVCAKSTNAGLSELVSDVEPLVKSANERLLLLNPLIQQFVFVIPKVKVLFERLAVVKFLLASYSASKNLHLLCTRRLNTIKLLPIYTLSSVPDGGRSTSRKNIAQSHVIDSNLSDGRYESFCGLWQFIISSKPSNRGISFGSRLSQQPAASQHYSADNNAQGWQEVPDAHRVVKDMSQQKQPHALSKNDYFFNELSSTISSYVHSFYPSQIRQCIHFPDRKLIQFDSGKLQTLAVLLYDLKQNGHKCLIFTQMSKMLDILEIFLNIHDHSYVRLDGSTGIDKRQKLMDRFNSDPKLFCFILSTRSGGLGINLTGADTVIFYDSDWNPAMDAQAQDRAHRIGQTREVHIYRLVCSSTIEENILTKAMQKKHLDFLVMTEGNFTEDSLFSSNGLKGVLNVEDDATSVGSKSVRNGRSTDPSTKQEIEAAMLAVEDEEDVRAMKGVVSELAEDTEEFDENKAAAPAGDDEDDDNVDKIATSSSQALLVPTTDVAVSTANEEKDVDAEFESWQNKIGVTGNSSNDFKMLENALKPVERFAIRHRELVENYQSLYALTEQQRLQSVALESQELDEAWDVEEIEREKELEERRALAEGELLAANLTLKEKNSLQKWYLKERHKEAQLRRYRKLTGAAWSLIIDPVTQAPFWFNEDTNEASYSRPRVLCEQEVFDRAVEMRFNAIPKHILLLIFKFLSPYPDRACARQVSAQWCEIGKRSELHKRILSIEMGATFSSNQSHTIKPNSHGGSKLDENVYLSVDSALVSAMPGDIFRLSVGHHVVMDDLVICFPLHFLSESDDPARCLLEVTGQIVIDMSPAETDSTAENAPRMFTAPVVFSNLTLHRIYRKVGRRGSVDSNASHLSATPSSPPPWVAFVKLSHSRLQAFGCVVANNGDGVTLPAHAAVTAVGSVPQQQQQSGPVFHCTNSSVLQMYNCQVRHGVIAGVFLTQNSALLVGHSTISDSFGPAILLSHYDNTAARSDGSIVYLSDSYLLRNQGSAIAYDELVSPLVDSAIAGHVIAMKYCDLRSNAAGAFSVTSTGSSGTCTILTKRCSGDEESVKCLVAAKYKWIEFPTEESPHPIDCSSSMSMQDIQAIRLKLPWPSTIKTEVKDDYLMGGEERIQEESDSEDDDRDGSNSELS